MTHWGDWSKKMQEELIRWSQFLALEIRPWKHHHMWPTGPQFGLSYSSPMAACVITPTLTLVALLSIALVNPTIEFIWRKRSCFAVWLQNHPKSIPWTACSFGAKENVRPLRWEALLRVQGTVGIPGASIAPMHLCEHLPGLLHQKLQLHMGVLGNWKRLLQKIPLNLNPSWKGRSPPTTFFQGLFDILDGIMTECNHLEMFESPVVVGTVQTVQYLWLTAYNTCC